MELRNVDIKNFKSIENIELDLEKDCKIIVGLSESGKSNFLTALRTLDSSFTVDKTYLKEATRKDNNSLVDFELIFTDKEKKTLNDFVEKNADNKLFLATATAWNYEKTKEPFRWFAELIDTYDNYEALKQKSFDAYDTDENGSLKKFTTQLLMNADFNISNYDFESKTLSGAEVLEILPEKFRMDFSELIEGKQFDLSMIHRFYENDGNTKEMPLNFDFESKGTKNLFYFAPVLMNSFNRGKTIIIDEIDNGLHPLLVEYILHLFYNSEFNKADAQLIFNTHDVNLLNLDNFRRDQIYFSEKKPENGATDLYSLDEFSPRKNENVQKGYLQGRYGAVPMISERDNLWKN